MTLHSISFYRSTDDGSYRAVCTCKWSCNGTREEVQCRAATHDLDEEGDDDARVS